MITIDGLQYHTELRQHTSRYNPMRQVSRGLSNKTIVQTFAGQIDVLDVSVLVYLDGQAPTGFGGVSDLEAAFDTIPVTISDAVGTRNMVFLGTLDLSRQYALVDQTAPFSVKLKLEEYVS